MSIRSPLRSTAIEWMVRTGEFARHSAERKAE